MHRSRFNRIELMCFGKEESVFVRHLRRRREGEMEIEISREFNKYIHVDNKRR